MCCSYIEIAFPWLTSVRPLTARAGLQWCLRMLAYALQRWPSLQDAFSYQGTWPRGEVTGTGTMSSEACSLTIGGHFVNGCVIVTAIGRCSRLRSPFARAARLTCIVCTPLPAWPQCSPGTLQHSAQRPHENGRVQ